MDQKILHGDISPAELAQPLLAEFDRGNLRAQVIGRGDNLAVQVGTRPGAPSGGRTALTIHIQKSSDGIIIRLGSQEWLGTAASLGQTTIATLMNPWNLLGRLDDIAQDVENLQLGERVWTVIDQTARALGTGQALSDRLRSVSCEYCGSANAIAAASCIACGAPLGGAQPVACSQCGFVVLRNEFTCPNCGQPVNSKRQVIA
jgi:DNA-directed RNA polymerase subunit RPC12/RpoP